MALFLIIADSVVVLYQIGWTIFFWPEVNASHSLFKFLMNESTPKIRQNLVYSGLIGTERFVYNGSSSWIYILLSD